MALLLCPVLCRSLIWGHGHRPQIVGKSVTVVNMQTLVTLCGHGVLLSEPLLAWHVRVLFFLFYSKTYICKLSMQNFLFVNVLREEKLVKWTKLEKRGRILHRGRQKINNSDEDGNRRESKFSLRELPATWAFHGPNFGWVQRIKERAHNINRTIYFVHSYGSYMANVLRNVAEMLHLTCLT